MNEHKKYEKRKVAVSEYDFRNTFRYNNDLNLIVVADLTAKEWDFFYALCALLIGKGEDEITIPISELREISSYQSRLEKRTRDLLNTIQTKTMSEAYIYIDESKEKQRIEPILLLSAVSQGDKEVTFRATPYGVSLFNGLRSNFTVVNLSQFTSLKSKYSKLLYRQLKQYRRNGYWTVDMEKFRYLMDIPTYEKTIEVMRRIVNPAVEELKQYFVDLRVEKRTEKVNGGEKIVGLIFTFVAEEPRTYNDLIGETLSCRFLTEELENI